MLQDYLHLINPFLSLSINVIVQVLSYRYIYLGLLKSEYLGFAAGIIAVLMLEFFVFLVFSSSIKDFIAILFANLIAYSALGYCYFHFINLGETARRIRILREIYDSKDGLSMKEILERYNAKEITEKRINRLLNNKQILYRNERYFIGNPAVLLIAKIIVMMKLIIIGKESEFDLPKPR
jgi:hypothetical protein